MKIENKEGNVKVTNAGQAHKFTISDDSAVMVIDSLINLYSDPIGSVMRELVSNAIDANRERDLKVKREIPLEEVDNIENFAKDKAYVEVIKQNSNKILGLQTCVIIKDYGNGLSPERVAKVFTVLGTSTKRITDKLIGGYGIGAKSAFAYTDTFYVKATHNKVERMYMLFKGNALPEMQLVHEVESTNCNNTEIIIPLKNEEDIIDFEHAIKNQLLFFSNVVYKGFENNFSLPEPAFESDVLYLPIGQDTKHVLHCIVGRVVYPIDFKLIPSLKSSKCICVNGYLRFKIGEVDLVPSRENLRYTDKTIEAIEKAVLQAQKDSSEELLKKIEEEDDFLKWWRFTHNLPLPNLSSWSRPLASSNEDGGVDSLVQLSSFNKNSSIDLKAIAARKFPSAPAHILNHLKLAASSNSTFTAGFDIRIPETYHSRDYTEKIKLGKCGFKSFIDTLLDNRHSIYEVPNNYRSNINKALISSHNKSFIIFKARRSFIEEHRDEGHYTESDIAEMLLSHNFIYEQIIVNYNCFIKKYEDVNTSSVDAAACEIVDSKKEREQNKAIFFKELYYDNTDYRYKTYKNLLFAAVADGITIEELEKFVAEGGKVIYGYSSDQDKLKMCGGVLISTNPIVDVSRTSYRKLASYQYGLSKYMIIKVAKSLSKELAQFTYVNDFFMDKYQELIDFVNFMKVKDDLAILEKTIINTKFYESVDSDVALVYKKASKKYNTYTKYSDRIYNISILKNDIIDLCSEQGLYDKNLIDSVKALISYTEQFKILYFLSVPGPTLYDHGESAEFIKSFLTLHNIKLPDCPYLTEIEMKIPELNEQNN